MATTTKTTKTAATSAKVEAKTEVKATPAKAVATKTEDTTNKTTKAEATKTEVAKKAPVKTETAKKAPAKTETVKKTPATEKVVKKDELYVQFSGFEFSYDELLEKVKADYIAQTGKKTINSTKLYVKPEDMKVYYVVNEKFMGDVYLG